MDAVKFSHRLCEICDLAGVSQKKRPHAPDVAAGKPLDAGEGLLDVLGQALDDAAAPALAFLALDDALAGVPVQFDQLAVGRDGRLDLGGADAFLEVFEESVIARG